MDVQEIYDIYSKYHEEGKLNFHFSEVKNEKFYILPIADIFYKEFNNQFDIFFYEMIHFAAVKRPLTYGKAYDSIKSLIYNFHFINNFHSGEMIKTDELIYIFLFTINDLLGKYKLKDLWIIISIFSAVMSDYFMTKTYCLQFIKFSTLASIFILKEEKIENLSNKYILNFAREVFTSDKRIIEQKEIYIDLIGKDIYKLFIDELRKNCKLSKYMSHYYKEEILYTFLTQAEFYKVFTDEEIENFIKSFASYNIFSKIGLKLLKKLNSSYIEKYESLLLMEELINSV